MPGLASPLRARLDSNREPTPTADTADRQRALRTRSRVLQTGDNGTPQGPWTRSRVRTCRVTANRIRRRMHHGGRPSTSPD